MGPNLSYYIATQNEQPVHEGSRVRIHGCIPGGCHQLSFGIDFELLVTYPAEPSPFYPNGTGTHRFWSFVVLSVQFFQGVFSQTFPVLIFKFHGLSLIVFIDVCSSITRKCDLCWMMKSRFDLYLGVLWSIPSIPYRHLDRSAGEIRLL